MLDTEVVQVTGRGTNVNFVIDDSAPMEAVAQGLYEHLTEHRALYSRGTITVNVGRRILEREELTRIKEILEKESGVTVSRFWCSPDILEKALSESVGFGVGVFPQDPPQRDDADRRRAREARKSSPWDDDAAAALEQWTAYVLEDTPPFSPRSELSAAQNTTGVEGQEGPASEHVEPGGEPAQEVPRDEQETRPATAPPADQPERESGDTEEAGAAANVADETHATQQEPEPEVMGAAPEPNGEPEEAAETPSGKEAASKPGPQTSTERVRPFESDDELVGLNRGNEALLIKTTCRSGEVIRYPGDVVVLADVNPGAEIIADGDILVFGNLRGLAHAGAGGDIQATIIASNLDTHRLQIGPYTGVAPKSNKRSKSNTSKPRIALVRRRAIYVAPYAGRFAGYSGGTLYDG